MTQNSLPMQSSFGNIVLTEAPTVCPYILGLVDWSLKVEFCYIMLYYKTISYYNLGKDMAAVKLSESIISEAKIISKALNRSVAGQIEHWAKIGRLAEENPDLTYEFIKNLLIAQQEAKFGKLENYSFDEN